MGKSIALYLAIGLIGNVLPFLFYVSGMDKGLYGATASVVVKIEPLTASTLGVVFLRESISSNQILGMLLIILGATIPILGVWRRTSKPA